MPPFLRAFLFVFPLTTTALQAADDTGLKPGLWETHPKTLLRDGNDLLSVRAAQRAKMEKTAQALPPEQRRQMLEMASGIGRFCVSKGDPSITPGLEQPTCTPTFIDKSTTRVSFTWDCTVQGIRTAGKGERTIDGDIVHTRMESTRVDLAGARHETLMETDLVYVGADCAATGSK